MYFPSTSPCWFKSSVSSVLLILGLLATSTFAYAQEGFQREPESKFPKRFTRPPTNFDYFAQQQFLLTERNEIYQLFSDGEIDAARLRAIAYLKHFPSSYPLEKEHRQALSLLADIEFYAGNFEAAEACLIDRRAMETNDDRIEIFIDLRIAVAQHAQGRVAEARRNARHWLNVTRASNRLGELMYRLSWDAELATALRQFADNLILHGHLPEAALIQSTALDLYRGDITQELVLADELPGTRMRQRSFRLALPLIKRAEALIRRVGASRSASDVFDPRKPTVAITREFLFSEAHRAMGDLEPWYRRRLHSGTFSLVQDGMTRYRTAKSIGVAYLAAGDLPNARDEFAEYTSTLNIKRMQTAKEVADEFAVEHGIVLCNAALCASLCGDANWATALLNDAAIAMTDNPHVSPIDLAILEGNRARLCTTACDLKNAVSHARNSVEIASKHLGSDHPDTLILKTQLAYTLEMSGQYAAARELYRACSDEFNRLLGPGTTYRAYVLNRLGYLDYLDQDYATAEHLMLSALAIYDETEFPHDDGQLDCLRNLAALYRRTIDLDKLRAIEERLPATARKTQARPLASVHP